jgi:chromosome partitioning protein
LSESSNPEPDSPHRSVEVHRLASKPESVPASHRNTNRSESFAVARIISVANQKGGVGKTTTAINLAAGLAKAGRTALVVDFDPQCNATSGLGVAPVARHPLVQGQPLRAAMVETSQPRLSLLPGSQSLADADALSAANRQRASTLRQQLSRELDHFDFVLLDCPPSLGQLTRAALSASSEVYVPIQCEYFAMEGLSQIIELARQTKSRDNPRLEIGGIVLTMFDPALELANEVADEVREYFARTVFESLIPRDVSISEAPSHGMSVLEYAPRARGARAYVELVLEVIDREQETSRTRA